MPYRKSIQTSLLSKICFPSALVALSHWIMDVATQHIPIVYGLAIQIIDLHTQAEVPLMAS